MYFRRIVSILTTIILALLLLSPDFLKAQPGGAHEFTPAPPPMHRSVFMGPHQNWHLNKRHSTWEFNANTEEWESTNSVHFSEDNDSLNATSHYKYGLLHNMLVNLDCQCIWANNRTEISDADLSCGYGVDFVFNFKPTEWASTAGAPAGKAYWVTGKKPIAGGGTTPWSISLFQQASCLEYYPDDHLLPKPSGDINVVNNDQWELEHDASYYDENDGDWANAELLLDADLNRISYISDQATIDKNYIYEFHLSATNLVNDGDAGEPDFNVLRISFERQERQDEYPEVYHHAEQLSNDYWAEYDEEDQPFRDEPAELIVTRSELVAQSFIEKLYETRSRGEQFQDVHVKIEFQGGCDITLEKVVAKNSAYANLWDSDAREDVEDDLQDAAAWYLGNGTPNLSSNNAKYWLYHEPYPGQFGTLKDVMDLIEERTSLKALGYTGGRSYPELLDLIDSLEVSEFIYDHYALNASHNSWSLPEENKTDNDYPASIQEGFDVLIHKTFSPTLSYHGMEAAARAVKNKDEDIKWYWTLQCQNSQHFYTWEAQHGGDGKRHFKLNHRRPRTEGELFAQGNLALCYGAKGFSIYSYSTLYDPYRNPKEFDACPDDDEYLGYVNWPAWDNTQGTVETENMGSYKVSGLVFHVKPNGSPPAENDVDAYLDPADGDNVFSEGRIDTSNVYWWVHKFFAETEELSGTWQNLVWEDAGSVHKGTLPNCITDVSTEYYDDNQQAWVADGENYRYAEFGIFSNAGADFNCDNNYVFVVNRRSEDDEARRISFRYQLSDPVFEHYYLECLSENYYNGQNVQGDGAHRYLGFSTNEIEPGGARLFRFGGSNTNYFEDDEVGDDLFIAGTVTVNPGVTLTVNEGVHIYFTEGSSLEVKGRIKINGTETNPVYFIGNIDDGQGELYLNNSSADTIRHAIFYGMETGVKSNNSSTTGIQISQCKFLGSKYEGLKATSGIATVDTCEFNANGYDGAYLYNCKATVNSCKFENNSYSGIYAQNINSNSSFNYCEFTENGRTDGTAVDAGVRFSNCSPTIKRCTVTDNNKYGMYGSNGAYPYLYLASTSACNSIEDNGAEETYWVNSYPNLNFGHNNFSTDDDTLIYISDATLTSFYCKNNYWGGGNPITGNLMGDPTYYYSPVDYYENIRVFTEDEFDPKHKQGDDPFAAEDEINDHAISALCDAYELEEDGEFSDAIDDYLDIVSDYSRTFVATVAVDRLFWLTINNSNEEDINSDLAVLRSYYNALADTCGSSGVVRKAERMALWTYAAQHQYEDAISGFEAIVQDAECIEDSIFAVIDLGALHLEAQEWAERNELNQGDAVSFGSYPELCPADYPDYRKRTDDLFALLMGIDGRGYDSVVPTQFFLAQNYPNPFNDMTRIQYGLPLDSKVQIRIYDIMGREVATLVNGEMKAGYYTVPWMSRNNYGTPVSSGVYFCRIQAGNYVKTTKMTLLK